MNLPPATPSTTNTTSTDNRARDGVRPVEPRDAQQQRDNFERLLRSKAGESDEADEALPEGGAGIFPTLPLAPQSTRPLTAGAVSAAVQTDASASRAAIGAALTHSTPAITPVGSTDPAAVWEASVRGADSVPLDVRVMRAEKAPGETQAGLTLTIGSSGVNAEVLVRHAPRLNERLRKHGVEFDHVRIQRDEGDA
jgi:hypothetical protein